MAQVVIENPILNSPFAQPTRHFQFDDDGITDKIEESRRVSAYFVPIAQPKKKGKQLVLDTEWTKDRVEDNVFINRVRLRVAAWRDGHYPGVTRATAGLLAYWNNPDRDKKLFFCQIEALETAIYLAEAAKKYGDAWIENELRLANQDANPLLDRIAFKMATGSGKTVVMAMLIAWQTLNKLANPQDARFSDSFLIVTPGITIRDRLRVLLPNDAHNYYRERDVVPAYQMDKLGQARILITNFHAFLPRERVDAGKVTKGILAPGDPDRFKETPDQMVRRVCRELGTKKGIVVINDEAHHCYRRRVAADSGPADEPKLTGEDRRDADKRNEEARIWISGVEAVKAKLGVKAVYDLSATPFFLRGSGYSEGTLFPWVVSDFSLIDAIEAGIVKVPRVPVADDSMQGDEPTYRNLWIRIRDHLPKKGRGTERLAAEPHLPKELQGALHSLYTNYKKAYQLWQDNALAQLRGLTPPVFIVVCSNTNVSKLVYDYIAGWEKPIGDEQVVQAGALDIFRNDDGHGQWLSRPNTILVDSEQLESGEAMSAEFKQIAAREIDEFKAEYRARFPGRDADELTDEDLLREVMNTVGKAGMLGERVKCVVSVSMLTEGWDANTVTHILGIRAFGTQLLCEQVVGRGLRRRSYSLNSDGRFEPEYAEVYGVPFSFIPCSGASKEPKPGPMPTRVRALDDRRDCEMTFPRLIGYRYDVIDDDLDYEFTADSRLALSTADIPSMTENHPIVGEKSIHRLDDLKERREQEVTFLLAKKKLEKYFRQNGDTQAEKSDNHKFESAVQAWRFPQLLEITRRWLAECVTLKDNTFKQMLLLIELAHDGADRIYQSITRATSSTKVLKRLGGEGASKYDQVELQDGTRRAIGGTDSESGLPQAARVFRVDNLMSQSMGREKGEGAASWFAVQIQGNEFLPNMRSRWKTNQEGMGRLVHANRVQATSKTLGYVRFLDDFPAYPITNTWMDIGGIQSRADPKIYVVQTATNAVGRCVLMTTDPGDLVLDPTCGSGTAAYVAEQCGRRWITIDTSRVALALARTRLMAARFAYYILADSPEGTQKEAEITGQTPPPHRTDGDIRKGFVYKRVPHVTLRSIANNDEIDIIHAKWQEKLEPVQAAINKQLKQKWEEWEIPRDAEEKWSVEAKKRLSQGARRDVEGRGRMPRLRRGEGDVMN